MNLLKPTGLRGLAVQSLSKMKNKGFTLIELMVTVGIFVLMTALLLSRYNSYYTGTLFTNLAYDIALTIRQAQSYGISVKVDPNSGNSFYSAYGVRFTSNSQEFVLSSYDSDLLTSEKTSDNVGRQIEKSYKIKHGAKVSKICLTACIIPLSVLDIVFLRPNPDTIVCIRISCEKLSGEIIIEIVAGDGVTKRNIKVNSVGKITVN